MRVSECIAYPFQVSMDQVVEVEVLKATRNANQLNVGHESLRIVQVSLRSR